MRHCLVAVVVAAAATVVPTTRVAALGASVPAVAGSALGDDEPERLAVRGIVTESSGSAFTITSSNRRREHLTFRLDAATVTSGSIAVGKRVSVRYRMDGDRRIATAVTVRDARARR